MIPRVDMVGPVEGIAETDRLIKVVDIQQHLETGAGILEIFILIVFKVFGTSSSGLDSTVSMTGTRLDSKTPATGTETGGGKGGVAVCVWGCGCAVVTVTGLT